MMIRQVKKDGAEGENGRRRRVITSGVDTTRGAYEGMTAISDLPLRLRFIGALCVT